MAIAYGVGTAKTNTAAPGRTGNGDLTCSLPPGWTAGHLCLLILWNDQGTGSTPNGWTQIAGSPFGSSTPKLQVWWRFLQAGDSDPVTTISGSGTGISHCANLCTYSGVNTATPIQTIGTAQTNTGSPMTALEITTGSNNVVVLGICGRGDNEDASGQAFGGDTTGVTERLDGGTNAGDDSQVSMYDKAFPTLGTLTGNGTATTSVTDPWISLLIALKAPVDQTVTLARPSLAMVAQAGTAVPGAITGALAKATFVLAAQEISTPNQTVTLARAVLALQAGSATAQAGAVAKALDAATLALIAQAATTSQTVTLAGALLELHAQAAVAAPGALLAALDRAILGLIAQGVTAVPGALAVALEKATLTLLAQAATGSAGGGAQTVDLARATLSLEAKQTTWISPLAVVLRKAALELQAQGTTSVPGGIARELGAAILQIVAREAHQALTVALQGATFSIQAQGVGATPGPATKGLARATLTIETRAVDYTPGATSRILDRAALELLARQLALAAGGQFAELEPAGLTFQGRETAAVPGATSRTLGPATLALVAQAAVAAPGPLVLGLNRATVALLAQALYLPGYGQVAGLNAAMLELTARVILTEGLIENTFSFEAAAALEPGFILTVNLEPAFRSRHSELAEFESEVES